MSIIHGTLGVPGRIKVHAENKRRLSTLRTDLETFRYKIRCNPEFDVTAFQKEFLQYRKRYSEAMQEVSHDIFRTRRMEEKIQISQVNTRLKDEILDEETK